MSNGYKKFNPGTGPVAQWMAQIPGLVQGFMQMKMRQDELKIERQRADTVRAEDIANRDRWRAEDQERRDEEFERNQWLQLNTSFRTDLIALYQQKQTEYEQIVGEYTKIAGKVDSQIKLNQTEEFTRVLTQEADDAMAEITNDINSLQGLILKQNEVITEIQGRNDFFAELGYELASQTDGYNTVTGTTEEDEFGRSLWTKEDLEIMVNNITADESFRLNNAHHLDASYGKDYVQKLSSPDDVTLKKMNLNILEYESQKLDWSTKNMQHDITKMQFDQTSDPSVIQATYIQSKLASLQSFDSALLFLPGFKESFNSGLESVNKYNEKVYQIPNLLTSEMSIEMLEKEAINDGYWHETLTGWDRDSAKEYLEWKETSELGASSGLAMLIGPDKLRLAYAREERKYASFQSVVAGGIAELNKFAEADDKTKLMMIAEWSERLGLTPKIIEAEYEYLRGEDGRLDESTVVSYYLNHAKDEIGRLTGVSDPSKLDLIDNDFMNTLKRIQKSEREVGALMRMSEDQFMNAKDYLLNNNTGLFNNDIDLKAVSNIDACGADRIWSNALGMCVTPKVIPSETDEAKESIHNAAEIRMRKLHNLRVQDRQLPGDFEVDEMSGRITKYY